MKKIFVAISVVLVALVIFGAGFWFAQTQSVNAAGLLNGYGPRGNHGAGMMGTRGAQGQMRGYVEQALAEKLGMTLADVQAQEAAGKSMYQIALDKGIAETEVTALLSEVHKTAFDQAVAAGVMTQVQADAMLQNMSANGFNDGNCTMQNGTNQNWGGMRGVQGGMRGGWNQQTTPGATP